MIEPQMTTPTNDRTAKTTPPQKEPFRRLPQHMLAHSQPEDNTECFGRKWASSCSGKHGFGPALSMVHCWHANLHLIGTIMGLLAVEAWE
jgi:hypothetical protein